MKKPEPTKLSPDEFVLTKKELLHILSKVQKHWNRNEMNYIENKAYDTAIQLVKTSIKINPIKVLKNLYFSIVTFVDQVRTINSLKLTVLEKSQDDRIQNLKESMYKIEWDKLENGEAFIEN